MDTFIRVCKHEGQRAYFNQCMSKAHDGFCAHAASSSPVQQSLQEKPQPPHTNIHSKRLTNRHHSNASDLCRLEFSVGAVRLQLCVGHDEARPLWLHR